MEKHSLLKCPTGRYQTWPGWPCQTGPHTVPMDLACCSAAWNASHINIRRKRNARQGERDEEFTWAQNWGRWRCPTPAGSANGGAGVTPAPTAGWWGLDFLAVTYFCKKLASKDRVKVFLSPAGAGGQRANQLQGLPCLLGYGGFSVRPSLSVI